MVAKKPISKIARIVIPLSVTAVTLCAIVLVILFRPNVGDQKKVTEAVIKPSEENRINVGKEITAEKLRVLKWQKVSVITDAIATDPENASKVTAMTSGISNPPTMYLRGLLLMIGNKPSEALSSFDLIKTEDIPPEFLYPPYRLQRNLKPAERNKYLPPLRKAVDSEKVAPLIRSRVQAQEGQLVAALSSYLKTDPARWVRYDVECIGLLANHTGLQPEVRRMIGGALKSGRIKEDIAKELRTVALSQRGQYNAAEIKRRLKQELSQKGILNDTITSSITGLLENRKLFVNKKYDSLLKKYEVTQPMSMTTETALLLFLSAVQLENKIETYRWVRRSKGGPLTEKQ